MFQCVPDLPGRLTRKSFISRGVEYLENLWKGLFYTKQKHVSEIPAINSRRATGDNNNNNEKSKKTKNQNKKVQAHPHPRQDTRRRSWGGRENWASGNAGFPPPSFFPRPSFSPAQRSAPGSPRTGHRRTQGLFPMWTRMMQGEQEERKITKNWPERLVPSYF